MAAKRSNTKKTSKTPAKPAATKTVKKAGASVKKAVKAAPQKAHKAAANMMAAGQALQTGAVILEGITQQLETAKKGRKGGRKSAKRR